MRKIFLNYDDRVFKRLENMKEVWKIEGKCTSWEDFILKAVGLVKGGKE